MFILFPFAYVFHFHFYPLTFILRVSLALNEVSCRHQIDGSNFSIQSIPYVFSLEHLLLLKLKNY